MQRETDMTDQAHGEDYFDHYQALKRQLPPEVAATVKDSHDLRAKLERQLRADLTEAQKAEALRIGRIDFKSAGATRKR
jgi:hypothetical protein